MCLATIKAKVESAPPERPTTKVVGLIELIIFKESSSTALLAF